MKAMTDELNELSNIKNNMVTAVANVNIQLNALDFAFKAKRSLPAEYHNHMANAVSVGHNMLLEINHAAKIRV